MSTPTAVSPVAYGVPLNNNVTNNGSLYQFIFVPTAVSSGVGKPKQIDISEAIGKGVELIVSKTVSAKLAHPVGF